MGYLLHHALFETAARLPNKNLLLQPDGPSISAEAFANQVIDLSNMLLDRGLQPNDRVAVFLPKTPLCAFALYAVMLAGGIVVPVNPSSKPHQVLHILRDSEAHVLITNGSRFTELSLTAARCPSLRHAIVTDYHEPRMAGDIDATSWAPQSAKASRLQAVPRRIDLDVAALLYTSGSTGFPKGVILSHRNLVEGTRCVADYLRIQESDNILALLPLSFDYGLNQLTTAVKCGASCTLFDYLFPRDVLRVMEQHSVTGLAGVPLLWAQLSTLAWPQVIQDNLRYITNSGGTMPESILSSLRLQLPRTQIFLMYGLTEAFRSTYLPPELIDDKKGSIGRAIPNVELLVLREDGSQADDDEPGELVHRGALVALGYWNAPEATALRFRPAPRPPCGTPVCELAVWSGDIVRKDKDGFLYFLGRNNSMIKASGYRVSPEEIEEVVYSVEGVEAAVAFGVPNEFVGEEIIIMATLKDGAATTTDDITRQLRAALPAFMQPAIVALTASFPRNSNGKLDRIEIRKEYERAYHGQRSDRI